MLTVEKLIANHRRARAVFNAAAARFNVIEFCDDTMPEVKEQAEQERDDALDADGAAVMALLSHRCHAPKEETLRAGYMLASGLITEMSGSVSWLFAYVRSHIPAAEAA